MNVPNALAWCQVLRCVATGRITSARILLAIAVAIASAPARAQTEAAVEEFHAGAGEFRDPLTVVAFSLPAGWKLERALRWGDHETTLFLRDPESTAFAALYYQSPRPQRTSVNVDAEMREAIEEKSALFLDRAMVVLDVEGARFGISAGVR